LVADTESAGKWGFISATFGSLLTANSFRRTLKKGQIQFDGNIELCYLHPKRFKPDKRIYEFLGIPKTQRYIIMRFVSWDAYHDKGLLGLSEINKIRAVTEFSRETKVFISSEKKLSNELEPYRVKIPPEKMHDALWRMRLCSLVKAHTDQEEKYGLVFNFGISPVDQLNAISKGSEILRNPAAKSLALKNRTDFLKSKIDVTALFVWLIENYPASLKILQETPDYQYRFM